MVADARASGEFHPFAILPAIEAEAFHSLAEGKIFAEADDVKADWAGKFQNHLRCGNSIICSPVTVVLRAHEVVGCKLCRVSAKVARLECCLRGKILSESS